MKTKPPFKFTKDSIRKGVIEPGKIEALYWDSEIPGFGIRLHAGGSRKWIFQYKLGVKHRRLTFGSLDTLSVADARDQAGKYHAQVGLGNDPAGEKAQQRAKAVETFQWAADAFLKAKREEMRQGKFKPRSYLDVERHLTIYAKPLHRLQLDKVDRRAIADLLNTINGHGTTRNRVRGTLSNLYGWCMRQGYCDSNPVIATERKDESPRDRVLISVRHGKDGKPVYDYSELQDIWSALEDDHFGAIVRLLLLTGQRLNEIAGLRWSEIDFEHNAITLPRERTKNGRQHLIPMSVSVRAILDAQKRRAGRDLVFGFGQGPFSGWSKAKGELDERIAEARKKAKAKPMPAWVLHDLRRSAATGMASLGIQPHVVEAVLNHVSGSKSGVAGIYNLSTYEPEKRQALDIWASQITSGGGKILPMKRQA